MKFIKSEWFKILISLCVILITIGATNFFFVSIPEDRAYNRQEAKRFECKQDVQGLFNQYNTAANSVEQTEENQQALLNLAINLGLVDQTGKPIDPNTLIQDCISKL